ncbi:MAG: DUF2845 domain-containing protein [Steroidobacteraceae bacterium]
MKKIMRGMTALAATLAIAEPAAADSMRCGTKLMTDGDPLDKVAAFCGPPTSVERREILRPYYFYRGSLPISGSYEISVELWTYNFGPHKLMHRLRFEDGLLVDVETLSHGYNAPAY